MPHFRASTIVVLTLQGSVVYTFNGEDIRVRPGQILIMPQDVDTHAWRTVGRREWVVRWFRVRLEPGEGHLVAYPARPSGVRLLDAPSALVERLRPLYRRMAELRGQDDAISTTLRESLARAALHEIRAFYGPPDDPHDAAVAQALALIDQRLDDPELALRDLVAVAGCSRSVFVERFTAALGTPPMQHVEDRRLRLAAERLRQDEASVTAVAASCGYRSPQYFATRFRRRYGCSPRGYRAGASPIAD